MDFFRSRERSVFLRAFIPILVTILILEACFIVFFYFLSAKNVKDQLGSKAMAIASAVSVLIEQDIDNYKQFVATLDRTSDYYIRMNKAFDKILRTSGDQIVYLDTTVRHSEAEFMYIFDGYFDESSPFFVPPGTVDTLRPGGRIAYEQEKPYIAPFGSNSTSKWGNLLSAYVPIRDGNGDFLGMVTVQATEEKYQDIMDRLYLFAVISLAFSSIIISLILGYALGYIQSTFSIDNLTGLHTRSALTKMLKQQQGILNKEKRTVVVFMADLDHFKRINDTYGHSFGDLVLNHVAGILQSSLRKSDCLVRYGGEEFAGCLPNTEMAAAEEIMHRMCKAVENTAIYNEELGKHIHITISIGYTMMTAGQSPATVINNADKALYEAKKERNRVVFYPF